MALSRGEFARNALIVFLLSAMAFAQFAAISDSHAPHLANDHCCLLCHIGVLPFLQADAPVSVASAEPLGWLAKEPDHTPSREAFRDSRSSRAPPSALASSAS